MATVKHSQEQYQHAQTSLQQVVDGLTWKIQLVTKNVETLVTNVGKLDLNRLGQPMVNPVFEEQGAIQT